MDIAVVDYIANHGESFLHRITPFSKIIFVGLVISSFMFTNDLILLISIYLFLLSVVILIKLPFLRVVSAASYPAIFALLFVIASWNGNWIRGGVIIFKALSAALAMVLLIVSTPYPDIFASMRHLLPKIIVEGLFFTYRSLFILLELMTNLVNALRIRGGLTPKRYVRNILNFASGLSLLLVRGIELSERFYGVMNIRGYSGEISGWKRRSKITLNDVITIAVGVIILCVSVGIKLEYLSSGNSFYLFGFSVLLVFVSTLYSFLNSRRI